jgi:hypothetical protein
MAVTTYKLAKAISLTDYLDTFTTSANYQSWDWKQFTDVKSTTRQTEQMFGYYGVPIPTAWGQQGFLNYGEIGELDPTTWTMVKYGVGMKFSYEILKYDQHIKDLLAKSGKDMGSKHGYLRDIIVAEFFNDIATNTAWDGIAYAGIHTLKNGTTVTNDLTAASLDYDNLWTAINFFATSFYDHTGARIVRTPKYILTNVQNKKTLDKILTASGQPDSGIDSLNNPNLLKGKLTPVYSPFISSTTQYTILGESFKDDFIMFEVEAPKFDTEDDLEMHGTKIISWQIISAPKARDWTNIVNNAGA